MSSESRKAKYMGVRRTEECRGQNASLLQAVIDWRRVRERSSELDCTVPAFGEGYDHLQELWPTPISFRECEETGSADQSTPAVNEPDNRKRRGENQRQPVRSSEIELDRLSANQRRCAKAWPISE
ncbi:hypothetical protein RRG08_061218 [Elysia crispata]|uniref:Uncharacterized protein n=1 Tax=Elysia crispata TaxID=231223 RepID=A0AAE0ZG17_9GAST|nr:hypothetical protein RRG08_061218 [Elysia crispata]